MTPEEFEAYKKRMIPNPEQELQPQTPTPINLRGASTPQSFPRRMIATIQRLGGGISRQAPIYPPQQPKPVLTNEQIQENIKRTNILSGTDNRMNNLMTSQNTPQNTPRIELMGTWRREQERRQIQDIQKSQGIKNIPRVSVWY